MSTSPLSADLVHVLLDSKPTDETRSMALELAADPTMLESSIISACLQAGYTKDEIKALLQWQQLPEHGLFTSREEPAWHVTDGCTWRSLSEWVADYRAEQEAMS